MINKFVTANKSCSNLHLKEER